MGRRAASGSATTDAGARACALALPLELCRPCADAVLVGDCVPSRPAPLSGSTRSSRRFELTQHTQHLIATAVGKLGERRAGDPAVLRQQLLEPGRRNDVTRTPPGSSLSPDGRAFTHGWLRRARAVALQLITSGLEKSNLSMQHVKPVLNRLRYFSGCHAVIVGSATRGTHPEAGRVGYDRAPSTTACACSRISSRCCPPLKLSA